MERVMIEERENMHPDDAGRPVEGNLESELAAARERIANLEIALGSSRRIAAAVGVVMTLQKVTYEAAFDLLATASQRDNLKQRDLAEEVLLTGALPNRAARN
jgi:AmiR/NasT family two-component response regulator